MAASSVSKDGFSLGGGTPTKDKNAHLKEGPKAKKPKKVQVEEKNAYANWSLMVDKSDASTSCGDTESDGMSMSDGASTIAGFTEEDSIRFGLTLWFKDETAEECLQRWLNILDICAMMLDLRFLGVK